MTGNNRRGIASIPVVGVESVEAREACGLQITCKFGRVYKYADLSIQYSVSRFLLLLAGPICLNVKNGFPKWLSALFKGYCFE